MERNPSNLRFPLKSFKIELELGLGLEVEKARVLEFKFGLCARLFIDMLDIFEIPFIKAFLCTYKLKLDSQFSNLH